MNKAVFNLSILIDWLIVFFFWKNTISFVALEHILYLHLLKYMYQQGFKSMV